MATKVVPDDAENVKDHYNGARTSGLRTNSRAARCKAIVKTGHPMLDVAIAADREVSPNLRELREACRRGTTSAPLPHADTPAVVTGRPANAMALTLNRHGRGPTLHVATTHRIVDVRRRARTITVWHELATFDCN